MRPTIRDVAERAGVSIATVSRVIRDSEKVRPETRDRVSRAVSDLQYTPSQLGRQLAERRHAANGIVFPDLYGPYYAEVVLGYEEVAAELGRSVLILSTHGRDAAPVMVEDMAGRCDGLVILGRTVPDQVVDRTWGRGHTFFDEPGAVVHVAFADPYCPNGRRVVLDTGRVRSLTVVDGGTLVVVNGPRFSSRAESLWHQAQGWSIVGMTAASSISSSAPRLITLVKARVSRRACSTSQRERAMSARTLPCSLSLRPNATRDSARRHMSSSANWAAPISRMQ